MRKISATFRALVRQQHATRADADALRLGAQAREQDFGTGVAERGDGVVLGEPVAVVAECVGAARELERLVDRLRGAVARNDRRLVEDGQFHRCIISSLNRNPPLELRPASVLMDPRRAGAVVPDALSFPRSTLRELVRGRWKIEKLRFDLDAEGRGEILYRLVPGVGSEGWVFHFFLVSLKLDEAQKMDRNWAQSWDAMGVLCQGEWTPEREALLRIEVPKQRAGYADYDTLVYARGNRSARLFDHVVERLAAGRQPDAGLLARVGYILRTTAFIANGQLGTRPYAGFEPDHPFRRPYHVQMCSAFLLREYVFDLVDHIARARNPAAVRLDPAYRRYLGLGNAAATGLVAFLVNHPHFMHQWSLAHEAAFAAAKRRGAGSRDEASERFARLLDRAIRYHREGEGQDSGVFTNAGAVADDLARARTAFAA